MRVEERVVANEEPAVLSILSERALLVLERDIARQPFAAFIAKPSHIFRMEDTLPESLGLVVVQSESEIVEDETVGIKRPAVRIQDDDRLRNQVGNSPQLLLVGLQARF